MIYQTMKNSVQKEALYKSGHVKEGRLESSVCFELGALYIRNGFIGSGTDDVL